MRSRYSAYATERLNYVFRTWHPRTRPDDLSPTPGLRWTGLEIVDVLAGGVEDDEGVVEFRASFSEGGDAGVLRERSIFVRRGRRWVYVDGSVDHGSVDHGSIDDGELGG